MASSMAVGPQTLQYSCWIPPGFKNSRDSLTGEVWGILPKSLELSEGL